MIKQIGIFKLIVGDPSPIHVSIEDEGCIVIRFEARNLIDLKRCIDDAIQTAIYKYEKIGDKEEAEYLRALIS